MMKAALLAAAALVVGASAANAKSVKVTFATSSGSPYCDGLTLKSSDNVIYSGIHSGSCEAADSAGGFALKLGTEKILDIATTDTQNAPGLTLTFLLDTKAAVWALYSDVGSGFQALNSGVLLPGAPPAKAGAKAAAQIRK